MSLDVQQLIEVPPSMSSSTPPYLPDRLIRLREAMERPPFRQGIALVAVPLRFVGFWLAVALPFLYLPLLYDGLTGQQAIIFGALLALNVAALVAGHSHRQ